MIWTIIAILLILWILGLVTKTLVGGMLHILLVIAIILLIVRLVSGRRVV
ncbi:MAG TPA: lmo0937 family membrane protein [Thermoanaerobaculia bacterium]|nr:lmo0937 family membrane protein [Thermoanaerobaculia bacterium]